MTTGVKSKTGDLLIPCSTTTNGNDLSNITEIREDNVLLGGDITILRFKKSGCGAFYAYYLTHYKTKEIAEYAQGSTIIHLYFSHFRKIVIDLPETEEQQKIADFLMVIDEKILTVEQELNYMKIFKRGLLQQMFL